jgi:hypothetical protein
MHVLLLRPVPRNDRFGLGPFFRIEPLGLEYIAAALEMRGHRVTVADLRYSRSIDHLLRTARPGLVGIACMYALETDDVLALAEHVRRASSDAFILIGGHSAAAYPSPFSPAWSMRSARRTASSSCRRWPTRLTTGGLPPRCPDCCCRAATCDSTGRGRRIARSRSTTCPCRCAGTSTAGVAGMRVCCSGLYG